MVEAVPMESIRPWKIVGSRPLPDYRIFQTRTDRVVSPRTGAEHDVFIVTGSSWVNVLALTREQQIVLVQQYRHGVREVMWEIPGGAIDGAETPEVAGVRELLEETGGVGGVARIIGKVRPNPAFQTNWCYTLLIENVEFKQPPRMEGMEDIAMKLVAEDEFARMITDGRIPHALVVVADFWRRLWRAGANPSFVV